MTETTKTVPVYDWIIAEVQEGKGEIFISAGDIRSLLERQADLDESEDEPELLAECNIKIENGYLHFFAPYTISGREYGGRVGLAIEGKVANLPNDTNLDHEAATVYTDEVYVKSWVLEAFDEKDELPVEKFLRLMFEDALEGKVTIGGMRIVDNNLNLSMRLAQQVV